MMITSAVCWGSWANTFKGVKNYRFELFYWDYAIGIFLFVARARLNHGKHSRSSWPSLSLAALVAAEVGGVHVVQGNAGDEPGAQQRAQRGKDQALIALLLDIVEENVAQQVTR